MNILVYIFSGLHVLWIITAMQSTHNHQFIRNFQPIPFLEEEKPPLSSPVWWSLTISRCILLHCKCIFTITLPLIILYDLKALSSLYTATTETTPASMDLYMALSVYGGGQKETFVWSKVHSIECGITWPKRIKTEKGWFMHWIFYSLMKGWREIEENL